MPTLTRWMIKTALVYLVLAFVVGLLEALGVRGIGPVYVHLFVVGWVTLLIFGVVFWMFPKFSKEQPRGSERLGWATYWLLNVGLALRVLSEPIARPGTALGWVLVISAVLQWLAAAAFVANTWQRVREK